MSKRPTTIYDACAGRRTANDFLPEKLGISAPSHHTAINPRDLRKGAVRDDDASEPEDTDIKVTLRDGELPAFNRNLVPDTDLLEAIHGYISDFYGVEGRDTGTDWGSLDETALLAMGVLVEEQVRQVLGSEGDMVFTEEEDVEPIIIREATAREPRSFEKANIGHQDDDGNTAEAKLPQRSKEGAETRGHKRKKKRRRMESGDACGGIADV